MKIVIRRLVIVILIIRRFNVFFMFCFLNMIYRMSEFFKRVIGKMIVYSRVKVVCNDIVEFLFFVFVYCYSGVVVCDKINIKMNEKIILKFLKRIKVDLLIKYLIENCLLFL